MNETWIRPRKPPQRIARAEEKKIQARKRNPNESHFDYRSFLSSFSQIEQLRKSSKFEDEIRMEQEERKREEEEKAAE